ncbi:hypothetical protein H6M51_19835 [Rhizobium sp. AQ_MP]|uniref:hypothetical protein n=1 Tax=Rhizobium sp. AQ_MP TaxID=2761536 RepID=UPI00163A49A6|nr:hypothetical protein [Rhizobium sp. AQ_MP]MBC2775115.1 hypothetical protein [Rhizobium sp. AQ_MP]
MTDFFMSEEFSVDSRPRQKQKRLLAVAGWQICNCASFVEKSSRKLSRSVEPVPPDQIID